VRYKLRKLTLSFVIILLASFFLSAYAGVKPDEELFKEAKILIFDKKWEKAQEKLDEFLKNYPNSPLFSQAFFYKGKCLEKQKGKELKALQVYKDYLRLKEQNKNLAEESEISVINLAYALYEKGGESYLKEIEKRLDSSNKVIQYYAAFKLSYLKNKKTAKKGIPVLERILKEERDEELRDRARIAILRINPKALKDIEDERYKREARILKIRVFKKGKKKAELSVNIPWALADLALNAIPEKEKELMRKEGYDLDKIIKELNEFKGNIIEIKDEESIIKIWID